MKAYSALPFTFFIWLSCTAYKPVVIIHGVWDLRFSLDFLADQITEYHPGTEVHVVDMLHGWKSLAPLWYQVKSFYSHIRPIMDASQDGIILIGYSQGGIISRGIVESMDHNITTFISLSSPQAGQYGDDFLRLIFPQYIKETAYEVFYSRVGQRVSVANYWNDPHHQTLYYKYSNYLPYLNNEINESYQKFYRNNFMKLKKLVLIGGPDDGVITPWQSSHFGYFDKEENVTEMRDQFFYQNDLFGLRSLDKAGKIKMYEVPGVYHTDWHHNVSVIKNCILPWLD
ncbi:lysosomal thioesterase PPT2-A isoform X1 [Procambarus clarkii]|uniref:lysosomal thioesterase PPT2-A isoform X1 n=1 Tax=Procambarus clarkii TaxID=6728 RepID=UPI001E673AAF|nr:lysosomal thioesterase PPT2-A-like isoform X1 [Procambarus clarkii]